MRIASIYIAIVPEIPGCTTHGDTYEEAMKNAQEVMELCIEAEQALGRPLPQPHTYESF